MLSLAAVATAALDEVVAVFFGGVVFAADGELYW